MRNLWYTVWATGATSNGWFEKGFWFAWNCMTFHTVRGKHTDSFSYHVWKVSLIQSFSQLMRHGSRATNFSSGCCRIRAKQSTVMESFSTLRNTFNLFLRECNCNRTRTKQVRIPRWHSIGLLWNTVLLRARQEWRTLKDHSSLKKYALGIAKESDFIYVSLDAFHPTQMWTNDDTFKQQKATLYTWLKFHNAIAPMSRLRMCSFTPPLVKHV